MKEGKKINLFQLFFSRFFFISGTFFLVSTAVGMLRFPDFYTRLHAGSKCLVAGGISFLVGFIILEGFSLTSLKLLVLIGVLLLTNPAAVHAIARAAYSKGIIPDNLIRNDCVDSDKTSNNFPEGDNNNG